jgi:hypothetical protein
LVVTTWTAVFPGKGNGTEILDTFQRLGEDYRANGAASPGPALADTIQEDLLLPASFVPSEVLESVDNRWAEPLWLGPANSMELFSEDFDFDSALFKFANERESFLTDLSLSAGAITPIHIPKGSSHAPNTRPQQVTARRGRIVGDDLLRTKFKFANERESFLTDLSLSAGAITPNTRPRSRVRTHTIHIPKGSSHAPNTRPQQVTARRRRIVGDDLLRVL